jgi:ankyrin repeat protein
LEVLRHCSPGNLRRTLQELPKSLDETYKRILNEINNANRVHAYRLLQCLAVALRPLRVEELAEVLAFDLTPGGIPKLKADWRWEDQEEAVLSACSSLISVIVDDGSRVVQFSHFTVKEFLTSDRLASCMEEVSQFHIPAEPSHVILAQACLGVLLCLDDQTDKDSAENIPLYRYAAEYWIAHARVGDVELQIEDALDYFFDMDNPHFSALVRIKYRNNLLRVSGDEPPTGVLRSAAPLYFAAWRGLRGLVERLIFRHSQQINHFGGRYGTPFHASVVGGHLEVSQLLFAHGANINLSCSDNWTPLHDASRLGHVEIVKWLLNHGADVNSQEKRGRTPLYLAASRGDLKACRILLEHHAEVDSRSKDGSTPFLKALKYGHPDVARLLLDHNADVRVHGTDGNTPLHFAAYYGYFKVCRTLLERNAEVDSRNNDGYTPFLRAWKSGRNPDILQLFLDHNADVRVCDDKGNTPLHFAAEIGHLEFAQILLERNADVNSQNKHGSTPLLLASELGHPDLVQLLLGRSADLYLRDSDGDTPLHCAAVGGKLEVARILLKLNVDVNSRDLKGSTPLHLASKGSWRLPEGSVIVVQFLLDNGADVKARDLRGKTASEVTRGPKRREIVRLLSLHAAE